MIDDGKRKEKVSADQSTLIGVTVEQQLLNNLTPK